MHAFVAHEFKGGDRKEGRRMAYVACRDVSSGWNRSYHDRPKPCLVPIMVKGGRHDTIGGGIHNNKEGQGKGFCNRDLSVES